MLIYLVMAGGINESGGWGRYVRDFADYLADHGNDVKILSRMGEMTTVRVSGMKTQLEDLRLLEHRRISSIPAAVRHLPNPLTVLFGVMKLLRDSKVNRNTHNIIHAHDISSSLLIAFIVRKILRWPFLVQIHGLPLREQSMKLGRENSPMSGFVWFLTRTWHNMAISLIKASSVPVVVNNSEVKSFYESLGISSDKLKILPSAVDLKEHEKRLLPYTSARKRLHIGKSDFVVGYVGGLREEKNLGVLIEATKDFIRDAPEAKIKLAIIGEGPMKGTLEKRVKECNIEKHVLFAGYIPEAYRFLNAIDIFVLPSLSEGSPFSLIEAMSSGKAIVASNIPAIHEIVEDGKQAILVNPNKPGQFRNALLRLYGDPALRKELEAKARNRAKQYDVNVVFPKTLYIYRALK